MTTTTVQAQPPKLTGVVWQWVQFIDRVQETTLLTADYTIAFAADGTFRARADCNTVLGTYTLQDGVLTIKPGPTTLVACAPPSLGDAFVRYLSQVETYSVTTEGQLQLEFPDEGGTLVFNAAPQVTGTVSYRERLALPAGTVIRVEIIDVTAADAPTTIIGEQVITTTREQVPITFAVSYPADAVQEGHRYSLNARILDAQGKLLFISDTNTPVITDGNPTSQIALVLVKVGS